MCSRIIFSESILIPRKNIIFIQKIKKAIIDGAVPDRKLLQISVTSCSDAD